LLLSVEEDTNRYLFVCASEELVARIENLKSMCSKRAPHGTARARKTRVFFGFWDMIL
jgi:hypothetical protein